MVKVALSETKIASQIFEVPGHLATIWVEFKPTNKPSRPKTIPAQLLNNYKMTSKSPENGFSFPKNVEMTLFEGQHLPKHLIL